MGKMLLDFQSLLNKYDLNIRGVIHIGAHIGQEYQIYKNNGIRNCIFFEPLKDNFKKLKENIADDEVIFVNKALGNEEKLILMNVESVNGGQSSSILKPKHHLTQYPHITFDKTEEVEMIKLDNFMVNMNYENFNFINIDVQGYELEVFKGSSETLKKIDYIIAEVNRAELYENCASVFQIDDYLSKFSFERVETSWEGVTWGDALYVKNAKL